MNQTTQDVVVLGASGAVGGEAVHALQAMPSIGQITLLNRRSFTLSPSAKISQHVVDVFDPSTYRVLLPNHQSAICTFGVGQPSKVSKQEFTRVDKQAVLDFAFACKQSGVKHFSLLSSVGANAASRSFYLRSKGELADDIAQLGFERFSLFQPSVILTPNNRYGASQAVLLAVWPRLSPMLVGGLAKYRGIHVANLGHAIAQNLARPGQQKESFHWADIQDLAMDRHSA